MKLVVVVPAYNAARFLPDLVRRVLAAQPPCLFHLVIVDDGSQDTTAATARDLANQFPMIEAAIRPSNGGYGAAMKTGLAVARRLGADRAASLHADGQYSPEVLVDLLAALDRQDLDLLQGSRIAGGQALAGGMPLYKYAGNWAIAAVSFTIDRTAPLLTITSPADGRYYNQTTGNDIAVAWSGYDDGSGVAYYTVRFNEGSWSRWTTTSLYFSGVADGRYRIDVRAYDAAGNCAERSVNITVDLTAPTLVITSPTSLSRVPNQVVVGRLAGT